jgi:hypothetical protein
MICCSGLYAQNIELEAIGVSGGTFWAQNNWDPGFAFEINFRMGEVLDYIFMQPRISYWRAGKTEKQHDLSLQHIAFGTKLIGFITPRPRGPYVGTSIQYHVISEEKASPLLLSNSSEVQSVDIQKVSLSALAGYLQQFRKVSFALQVEYVFLPDRLSAAVVTAGIFYHL